MHNTDSEAEAIDDDIDLGVPVDEVDDGWGGGCSYVQ